MNNPVTSFTKNIPNIFTMMNLLSGCLAILLGFHDIALAGLLVLLAGVFDFADGMAARLFRAYSDFGKELDSLADMISFGVAPSFILFHLLAMSLSLNNPEFSFFSLSANNVLILATSFMPAVFAAIRLARYNTSGEEGSFSGLPSPAAGIFLASAGYVVITTSSEWLHIFLLSTWLLLAVNITLSILMVVNLPMFTIKFRNLRYTDNKTRYIFIIPAFFIFIYLGIKSIPVIIIYYILLSVIMWIVSPEKRPEKG